MNKIHLNTDHLSLEKIWLEITIDSLHYSHNDRESWNSLDKTMKFLSKAKTKAGKKFVNVRVEPCMEEGGEHNLDTHIIQVIGYRQETKEEYKYRLSNRLSEMQSKKFNAINTNRYYTSEDFEKELKKLQTLVEK